MWRLPRFSYVVGRFNQLEVCNVQIDYACYSKMVPTHVTTPASDLQSKSLETMYGPPEQKAGETQQHSLGENVSRRDKIKYLVTTLLNLNDSKEAIYGALDAWVAWEQTFPLASLRKALLTLEKEHQWHRVVQVIKWMMSKGQGTTMGTYSQLIRALDMDRRAKEAHEFWEKKIGTDLHSVPWQLCHNMISVYYRNNMLEDLVRLFRGLEAFNRKPRDKSVVKKVANAYEMLGLLEEREMVLQKYSYLFTEESPTKKSRKGSSKENKKSSQSAEKGQHKERTKISSIEK